MTEVEEARPMEELRAPLRDAQGEIRDLRIQLHAANTAVIRLRARLESLEAQLAADAAGDRAAERAIDARARGIGHLIRAVWRRFTA